MQTITTWIGPEIYRAANESGHEVTIDMQPKEHKQHQSPVELLLSAVSACSAVDVETILKKRKKTVRSFTIKADGTRREEPPRYFTHIHLTFIVVSPDVTEEELTKAAQLSIEKYCSVAASLKSEITFSVEVQNR